jgi:predicted nucleotidyltransferase
MIFESINISNLLSEIIDSNNIDMESIELHNELNPLFWNGDELKADVRKILLMNAKRFIEFCDLDNYKFTDIVLTGSIANYNYNENSDVDIHIIMDYNQINPDKDFVGEYFKLKKSLWADKLPIQVKGHDVELYIEDDKAKHKSTGIYSLVKNKWITKPTNKLINIDVNNLKIKVSNFINKINELESITDKDEFLKKYDELLKKLKKYRQTGLEKSGEFSTENLVFKIITWNYRNHC